MYARGDDRRPIYLDDTDRRTYLWLLGRVVAKARWSCLAYCLMHNHVHLLIETPEANLGRGMQRLHGFYAQLHNERHGRCGHVFQGRYGAVRMRSDGQLWTAAAYIAQNPREAGLCEHAEDWRWSSHAATLGDSRPPSWLDVPRLLTHFEAAGGDGRERYAYFVRGQTPLVHPTQGV